MFFRKRWLTLDRSMMSAIKVHQSITVNTNEALSYRTPLCGESTLGLIISPIVLFIEVNTNQIFTHMTESKKHCSLVLP